jgi:hypothetical protein
MSVKKTTGGDRIYAPHFFRFRASDRRMVCEHCQGLMNEAPANCAGVSRG